MELAYEKLLKEHNLTVADLPQDAQIGIKTIKDSLNVARMTEKGGKVVPQATWDKIKANDKWVVREILDIIEEKDTSHGALPHDLEEIKEDIKDTPPAGTPKNTGTQENADSALAAAIDAELSALHAAGKTSVSLDELKNAAPKTYAHIWETYEVGEPNGIETAQFQLLEAEKEQFNLKKV